MIIYEPKIFKDKVFGDFGEVDLVVEGGSMMMGGILGVVGRKYM